jgi:primosomal replication protein N
MTASGPSLDNHLRLVGRLLGPCQIRYSPAGLPIARFVLEHHSQQWEAELPRQAYCRITVLACGEKLAVITNQLPPKALVRVSGFISRANHRQAESWLVLHAQHIETLESS